MTGFGDEDKLAAAKELQRSFSSRADTPRVSARGGTTRGSATRGGRGTSTRGGLQSTPNRGGSQLVPNASSIRGRGGRGGRSVTRGSLNPTVNSPSIPATATQREAAPHTTSTQGLPGSATFGQWSTKLQSNFGHINSGGVPSGGLASSRFANESPAAAENLRPAAPQAGKQNAEELAKVKSGRMVGFYQSPLTEDDWKWIPDEPEGTKQGRKRRFSSMPNPNASPFVPSKRPAPAVASSAADIDRVNPRYTGYYQDANQQSVPLATQAAATTQKCEQSGLQGATLGQKLPQSGTAVGTTLNTTPTTATVSSTTQDTAPQQRKDLGDMHPTMRNAWEMYLQMTAPRARDEDAMEVDEEL